MKRLLTLTALLLAPAIPHAQGFAGVLQVESTPSSSTPTVTVAGQLLKALKHPSSDVQQASAPFLTPAQAAGPAKPLRPLPPRVISGNFASVTATVPHPHAELRTLSASSPPAIFRQKISLSGSNTLLFQPVASFEAPQAKTEPLPTLPEISQSVFIPLKSLKIEPPRAPTSGLELPSPMPAPSFPLPHVGNSL